MSSLPKCIRRMLISCASIIIISTTAAHCEDHDHVMTDSEMKGFLKFGQPVESSNLTRDVIQSYFIAINDLPDYLSCVILPTGSEESVALNYEKIHTLIELEVCLFWVSQEIQDLGRIRAFIERSGFHLDSEIQYPKSTMHRFDEDEAGVLLGAGMNFANVPNSLKTLFDRIAPPDSLSISILLTRNISPIDITAMFNRL